MLGNNGRMASYGCNQSLENVPTEDGMDFDEHNWQSGTPNEDETVFNVHGRDSNYDHDSGDLCNDINAVDNDNDDDQDNQENGANEEYNQESDGCMVMICPITDTDITRSSR